MLVLSRWIAFMASMWLAICRYAIASEDSIGPNGINSASLMLNGAGIAIGQVEAGRPGRDDIDTDATCCNADIEPAGLFARYECH